ncbi:MAG: hypothetical protein WKF68_05145 [Daejeonella sp.]
MVNMRGFYSDKLQDIPFLSPALQNVSNFTYFYSATESDEFQCRLLSASAGDNYPSLTIFFSQFEKALAVFFAILISLVICHPE